MFDIHELASLICMYQTYAALLLCYSTWITAVSLVFYISAPMAERSVPCVLCIVPCSTTPLGIWVCGVFVSVRRAQWGICPQPFAISCWLACSDCHRNGVLRRGGGSFCLGAAEHKHHRRREKERESVRRKTHVLVSTQMLDLFRVVCIYSNSLWMGLCIKGETGCMSMLKQRGFPYAVLLWFYNCLK